MRNRRFTRTPIAAALALACAEPVLAAVPGVAQIDWMETNHALVEVDPAATAYADLVTVRGAVEIPVRWSKWSGEPATRAEYRLDGQVIVTQALSGGQVQSGSAQLRIDRGGIYDLTVALCNADGCAESSAVELVVADTDGSHLDPIRLNVGEHHQPYVNTSDHVVAAYFVEWGVYDRQFPVDRIPAYNLTHLLYGFIPICGGDGINDALKQSSPGSFSALQRACAGTDDFEVAIHDPWAALQKPQDGHDWGTAYKGNFGQLMALKRAYPALRILPSFGGWTLSDPFYFMADPAIRARFVDSVETFVRTWKFLDGVDIDWEYPGGRGANPALGNPATDGETYVALMRELRTMLDRVEADTGRELLLTSAVSADPAKIALVDYAAAQPWLDLIFAMSYDFYGAWSLTELGHHAGLYAPRFDPDDDFNASSGINALIDQGADPARIALAVAMYGRGWSGVSGGQGSPFTGTASGPIAGTWEAGVLDYRDVAERLLEPGWQYGYDSWAEAAYAFNPETGDLVSFDDATSVQAKGAFVDAYGLAGLYAWEIDADNGDILNAMHAGLGHAPAAPGENAPPEDDAPPEEHEPPAQNQAPEVDLADGLRVVAGNTLTLEARARDPDGDTLRYAWTIPDALSPSRLDGPSVELTAPMVQSTTDYAVQVTVSDGALSATATTTVTVEPETTGGACSRTDPDAGNHPAWDADTVYVGGDTVSHGGLVWTAKYWTRGNAPAIGADAWRLISEVNLGWQAAAVYLGGDRVDYQGRRWEAKWWTRGDVPGSAMVWVDVGPALCN
ncbi:PKD domain-containing protein [Thiohalocapsa marina]|uniref:chitinase n=1 Tax=Thiohalocapsa marina TaxID=424902 RepID=A0A5M8FT47_9GAMM|nr:glycosyl hydrolase family 18 protein [Thiohalocapsa marina]KAA6186972.1 PKD domain-containing protein [Thiohalocapsa marina]